LWSAFRDLSDHAKPANGYHLKTGNENSVQDIDARQGLYPPGGMANVLNEEKNSKS